MSFFLFLWTLILAGPFLVVGAVALVALGPEIDWSRVFAPLLPTLSVPRLRVSVRWEVPA